MHGDMRNVHNILVGKSEGKRTLERHRQKWEGKIKEHLNK
jgi:hypothetical protein